MSITHTLGRTINDGSGNVSKTQDVTAGQAIVIDESIPAPSTNLQVALAFTVAKLKSIWIHSAVAMTLYTNDASTGAPQDTIALKAGVPLEWVSTDGYFAVPFAGNVTTLYVTLGGSTASTLQIRGIIDPT